ncbi:hypothetical protein EJ07DRAFT_183145 [Lizonia empirigonia]|nr:hypothetical protein EJ07DRAFT_183145 [Lizonia empirigonia]
MALMNMVNGYAQQLRIKRWAAIDDSYTAGTGAGRPLGHMINADEVAIKVPDGLEEIRDNWKCSRYNMAYPKFIETQFGAHVEKDGGFQYLACNGNRSEQIYQQAKALKGELDFVTFTAGGNGLCLAQIIKNCIMVPYFKSSACNTVIAKAQENVKSIIKGNVKQIDINKSIRDAFNEAAEDYNIKYTVGYADWGSWVSSELDARMCSPSSNGDYLDNNQPDMHFIKPDTPPWFGWQSNVQRDELRKRGMDFEEMLSSARLSHSEKRQINRIKAVMEARDRSIERTLYDSILYKSPNPRAAAPFHPNEAGHLTIASFALAVLMDLRSVVLGIKSPTCTVKDEFTYFSGTGSKYYVSRSCTNENYEDFCNEVAEKHLSNTINWSYSKSYDKGTPEEHDYVVTLGNGVLAFDKDQCIKLMKKLINSCDTSDNPMNWKGGGRYIRNDGDYKYELHPRCSNRPWPWPREPYGCCEGWWKVFFGQYTVEGAGFSTWDYGQKTMLPNMNSCYGLGTTAWKFDYQDNPADNNGYEWKATFKTPIWVRARCWNNNKVVKAAGGWTNGCKGND